eukprot:5532359-Pleurochrysis_carterae.AAC.3
MHGLGGIGGYASVTITDGPAFQCTHTQSLTPRSSRQQSAMDTACTHARTSAPARYSASSMAPQALASSDGVCCSLSTSRGSIPA